MDGEDAFGGLPVVEGFPAVVRGGGRSLLLCSCGRWWLLTLGGQYKCLCGRLVVVVVAERPEYALAQPPGKVELHVSLQEGKEAAS